MVLPSDVRIVPVAELTESLRSRVGGEEGDFAISRPGSRSASKLIDAGAATFLQEFRTPTTVVDASIRYGVQTGTDPEQVLEDAFGLVMQLWGSRYLVEAGSADQSGIRPTLIAGDHLAGTEVRRCVHVTEDTEVYEVRMPDGVNAAAKVLRPGHEGMMSRSLDHEATILRRLQGDPGPRLLEAGTVDERPYLLTEWCPGTDASTLAMHLRRSGGSRGELLSLAIAIISAYERLHERHVIHADVNPRNVLIGPGGIVRIVDFGLAISENDPVQGALPRGGWSYLYEPEAASNFLRGGRGSTPTWLGEQYSLAALLDQLFTGKWYLNFKASAEEMYRQILHDAPLGFVEREAEAWPEVETALRRALSKNPGDRFASLSELRQHLSRASGTDQRRPAHALDPQQTQRRADFVGRLVPNYRLSGDLLKSDLLPAPKASVGYGRAGIAHALYRMACAGDNPQLLAQADAWSLSAARQANHEEAYTNNDIGVTSNLVGKISTLFGPPGLPAVEALIAGTMGNAPTQANAAATFLKLASEPSEATDATLGLAGVLITGAMLVDAAGADSQPDFRAQRLRRRRLSQALEVDRRPAVHR